MHQNPLEGLLKQSAGALPRAFDSVDLGWDLGICTLTKLLGDPGITGLGTTGLEQSRAYSKHLINVSFYYLFWALLFSS